MHLHDFIEPLLLSMLFSAGVFLPVSCMVSPASPLSITAAEAAPAATDMTKNAVDIVLQKIQDGKAAEGLDLATKALASDPKNATLIALRGACYIEVKQPQKALEDLNRALQLDSNLAFAYALRGQAYYDLDQYDKAIPDLDIGIQSNITSCYSTRGKAHYFLKHYDQSIKDLTKAIELHPTASDYGFRAESYGSLQEYDKALPDFNKSLSLYPNNPYFLVDRALAEIMLEQNEAAKADLDKVLELTPDAWTKAKVFYGRSTIASLEGRYDEALADINQAIQIFPSSYLLYNERGHLYLTMVDTDAAIRDFQKAIELSPGYATAYYNLALALSSEQSYQQAYQYAKKADELQPGIADDILGELRTKL